MNDDEAVSEVIGQILIFGILSVVLVASLLGFSLAKDGATERAIEVRGDALIQRIGANAVKAALFAEAHPEAVVRYEGRIDLPQDLEGYEYSVDLDPDQVTLDVPGIDVQVVSALFQTDAGPDIQVCDQDPLPGGPLFLYLVPAADLATDFPEVDAVCAPDPNTLVLFLSIPT